MFEDRPVFDDMELDAMLLKKMQAYEAQKVYEIKSQMMGNPRIRKNLEYLKNPMRIGNEYHDTKVNDIEKDENIKKYTLSDFQRTSFDSSYNFYQQTNEGSPTSMRNRTKGYIYKNFDGEVVCKLTVEMRNNKSTITEFFISPEYMGYGLSNELLNVARNTFGVTEAFIHQDNHFCVSFLQKNNFIIIGKQKEYLMLSLERNRKSLNEAKVHNNILNQQKQQNNQQKPNIGGYTNINNNKASEMMKSNQKINIKNMSTKQNRFNSNSLDNDAEERNLNPYDDENSFSKNNSRGYIDR